jgi:hypothetical protein
MRRKKPLPTGLQILDRIYNRYYDEFAAFDKQEARREGKIYVPIDIAAIEEEMGVDGDIVFGRLYYHLENKHGCKPDNGSLVHLFALQAGGERHAVNFPYMASVLAGMRDERRKFTTATTAAIVSLVLAGVSLYVSVFV